MGGNRKFRVFREVCVRPIPARQPKKSSRPLRLCVRPIHHTIRMEINFSCDNYFFTQTSQTYTAPAHALLVHPIRMGGNAVNRKFREFREVCVRQKSPRQPKKPSRPLRLCVRPIHNKIRMEINFSCDNYFSHTDVTDLHRPCTCSAYAPHPDGSCTLYSVICPLK